MEKALEALTHGMHAELGAVVRGRTSAPGLQMVASSDRGTCPGRPRLQRAYAELAIGPEVAALKPGSCLLLSELGGSGPRCDPAVEGWLRARGLNDIGFICLGRDGSRFDILELHFTDLNREFWASIEDWAAQTLARVFEHRRAGLITETLARRRVQASQGTDYSQMILGAQNPACLTRSEMRVAVLVSQGLTAKAIAEEMAISPTTVRTHLRNIYAKTGLSSFHALARKLVSLEEQRELRIGTVRNVA